MVTEKFGVRSGYGAFGIVVTALFVAGLALQAQGQATQPTDVCAGMTQERCVPEVIRMRLGTVSTGYTVDRTYKTIQIGDPTIIDVRATTDRSFNLVAQTIGRTNFVLFDEMGGAVKNVDVIVEDDFRDRIQHTVEIHNLSKREVAGSIVGTNFYECSATRCRYLGATESVRPTEVSRSENSYHGLEGTGVPVAISPPPR